MKRQKQEKPISDELIDDLLKKGRTAEDINGLLKQLTKAVLERALQGVHHGCIRKSDEGRGAGRFTDEYQRAGYDYLHI
jgi:hypothetical protein